MRLLTLGVAPLLVLGLAGCASVSSAPDEAAVEPVELRVSAAKFSKTQQRPGEDVTLSMTVTNTGQNPAPNVTVQLTGLEETTSNDFADEIRERTEKDDLPDSTERAPWFIDEAPFGGSYAASNLYEGGRLEPGRSRTLRWQLNAQQPGDHALGYRVFGGLSDNAAEATTGSGLTGSVRATIADATEAS